MGTILERSGDGRDKHFVGRIEEKKIFEELICGLPPEKNILSIFGIGGIGKSTLLKNFSQLAAYKFIPYVLLNINNTKSSLDLMKEVVKALSGKHFKKFEDTLSAYYNIETKIQNQLNRAQDGGVAVLEQTSVYGFPIGAAVVGLLGKDRIKAMIGKFISPQDMDNYVNAILNLQEVFVQGLNNYCEENLVILFFDTYEEAISDVEDWLCNLLTLGLSSNYLLVIAGRDSIFDSTRFWNENRRMVNEIRLDQLKTTECYELIRSYKIDNQNNIENILKFSGNFPWAIELTVESLNELNTFEVDSSRTGNSYTIEQKVVERFLRQIKNNQKLSLLVKVCSVFDSFTEETIKHVLKSIEKDDIILSELMKYSFFKTQSYGFFALHDIVKEFIEIDFKTKQFEVWKSIHLSAVEYFRNKAKAQEQLDTKFVKYKIQEFNHLIKIDEDSAASLLIDVSKLLTGPVMLNEFYKPIVDISKETFVNQNNKSILSYFEAQLAISQGEDNQAIEIYRSIDDVGTEIQLQLITKAKLSEIYYRTGRTDEAYEVAYKGLVLSEKFKQLEFAAIFSVKLGEVYGSKGSLNNSEYYCNKAKKYLESINDPFIKGEINLLLAHIYLFRNNYVEGEINLDDAVSNWNSTKYYYGIAQAESSICWMSTMQGNWEEGKRVGIRAYNYFLHHQDEYFSGLAALNIAQIFYLQGDYLKSIHWNEIAHQKLKSSSILYDAISLLQVGMCYIKVNDYQKAIIVLEEAKSLENIVNEKYSLGLIVYHLALCYSVLKIEQPSGGYLELAETLLSSVQNKHGFFTLQLKKIREFILDENKLEANIIVDFFEKDSDYNKFLDIKAEFNLLNFLLILKEISDEDMDKSDTVLVKKMSEYLVNAATQALKYNPIFLYNLFDPLVLELDKLSLKKKTNILGILKRTWTDCNSDSLPLIELELQKRIVELGSDQAHFPALLERFKIND